MRDIAHGQFNFLKIDQRAHENVEVDMLNNTNKKKDYGRKAKNTSRRHVKPKEKCDLK